MVRKPQATTGIRLRQASRTGIWTLTRPDGSQQVFPPTAELRDICVQALPPLEAGYWLRDTPEVVEKLGITVNTAQLWTWVQL